MRIYKVGLVVAAALLIAQLTLAGAGVALGATVCLCGSCSCMKAIVGAGATASAGTSPHGENFAYYDEVNQSWADGNGQTVPDIDLWVSGKIEEHLALSFTGVDVTVDKTTDSLPGISFSDSCRVNMADTGQLVMASGADLRVSGEMTWYVNTLGQSPFVEGNGGTCTLLNTVIDIEKPPHLPPPAVGFMFEPFEPFSGIDLLGETVWTPGWDLLVVEVTGGYDLYATYVGTVPEPSALLLIASGLGGLAVIRKRLKL